MVIEAACAYRHRPALGAKLKQRQAGLTDDVCAIAWKAQHRLNSRYRRLLGWGKPAPQVIAAVGRELVGFICAIGQAAEGQGRPSEGYAIKELVAELGAALLCGDLDLALEPRADHAAYIANGLDLLKADNRAIFTAASHPPVSQQAADFIEVCSPRPPPPSYRRGIWGSP